MSNLFFCVWMIPVLLHIADCGKFELTAQSNEIITEASGNITLPCYIKSRISAENMIVEWFRGGRLVHRYTEGRDDYENQDPTFRMRTSLFKDELETGKVSLKLLVVKGTDEGNYTCSVTSPTMNWKDNLNIKVNVKAVGSQPVVSIEGHREAGMGLVCKTQGWNPEPQMVWLDNDGFPIPAGPPETTRDSEGLYTLRLRATVQKTGSNLFACTVKHKYMERDMTAMIHVPDELFHQDHTWKWVSLVFGVLLLAAAGYICFLLKRQKEQKNLRKENENLRKENENLSKENENLRKENEKLSEEKAMPSQEKAKFSLEEVKLSLEEVSRSEKLSQEKDDILQEKVKLSLEEDLVNTRGYQDFGVVRRNAVDLTLDPDTAHPNLILSADGKQVSYGDKQDRPDIPQRFNPNSLQSYNQSRAGTGGSGETSAPLVICPVDRDKPESLHLSESQTHESDSDHQSLQNQDHQSEFCEEINESVSLLENSASSKV